VSGESVETSPNGARLVAHHAATSTKQHREVPREEGAMGREGAMLSSSSRHARAPRHEAGRPVQSVFPNSHAICEIHHGRLSLQSRCLLLLPIGRGQSPNMRRSQKFSLVAHITLPGSSHTSLWRLRVRLISQVSALSGWSPRIVSFALSDQKGMQLLILPDVSAGYPSIFLPVSLAQHPQKIAAGQQMICTVVRILSLGLSSRSEAYCEEDSYDEAEGRPNDFDMARVLVLTVWSARGRAVRRGRILTGAALNAYYRQREESAVGHCRREGGLCWILMSKDAAGKRLSVVLWPANVLFEGEEDSGRTC
jgi:hypothetical protein